MEAAALSSRLASQLATGVIEARPQPADGSRLRGGSRPITLTSDRPMTTGPLAPKPRHRTRAARFTVDAGVLARFNLGII